MRLLKTRLLAGASKVLYSQHRLSKELRRLLHQCSAQEHSQVTDAIRHIKSWFLTNRDFFDSCGSRAVVEVEHVPQVYLPLERPLWRPVKSANISVDDTLFLGTQNVDTTDSYFSDEETVQPWHVLERLGELLKNQDQVTLSEVFAQYPVSHGIQETVAYVNLATKFTAHAHIAESKTTSHQVKDSVSPFQIELPEISFNKSILEA